MKKIIIIPALVAMALAGCSGQVNDAKKIVKEQLIDPASAQFENVVVQKTMMVGEAIQPVDRPVTCGWVNSRNRMGGMTGAVRFVVADGVSTFGGEGDTVWSEAFSMCVIHSDDQGATDRLNRDGGRALLDYQDAVDDLNKSAGE